MSEYLTLYDVFVSLVSILAEQYQKKPEETIKALLNCPVPIRICNHIYLGLTKCNDMKRLEDLLLEEKEIFLPFKPIVDAAENQNKMQLYKAIHTIDFLSKNI